MSRRLLALSTTLQVSVPGLRCHASSFYMSTRWSNNTVSNVLMVIQESMCKDSRQVWIALHVCLNHSAHSGLHVTVPCVAIHDIISSTRRIFVAGVNIDAKLIRNDRTNANKQTYTSTKDLAETVELENGCACKQSHQNTSKICMQPAWSSSPMGTSDMLDMLAHRTRMEILATVAGSNAVYVAPAVATNNKQVQVAASRMNCSWASSPCWQ